MTDPAVPTPEPAVQPSNAVPSNALPAKQVSNRGMLPAILIVAAMGIIGGASIVILLKSPANVGAAGATTTSTTAPRVEARSEPIAAAITPKWSGGVRRSNGHNVAVYELQADNDIAVWGKVVRPVLTVRCVAGTTEVFVLTQSAAVIDGTDGRHAVRVGYDAEPDGAERWMASDEYDALFAENGVGAARKIASARTMRFAFTPYNASPVVAQFQVAGFDTLASRLAKSCRW